MVLYVDLDCIILVLPDGEYPKSLPKNPRRSVRLRASLIEWADVSLKPRAFLQNTIGRIVPIWPLLLSVF